MGMIIVSWNLWCKNRFQVRSIHRLLQDQPDILCLQEVNPKTVTVLEGLENYDCLVASDYFNSKKGQMSEYKLVILLRRQTIQLVKHQILDIRHLTRHSLWDKMNRWQESLEYHFVDIMTSGGAMRVFNVHLEIGAGPKLRFEQFEFVLKNLAGHGRNIICGDFNIFAKWYFNLVFGLPLGYKWHEVVTNERSWFESKFRKFGFTNPFRHQVTYPFYKHQLDHILVPNSLEIREAKVIKKLHNSDHYPILLKLTKKTRLTKQPHDGPRTNIKFRKLFKIRFPKIQIK
jgi:endonuclease/exonuclease/phosphatase family metal-dependent hydrolase